MKRPPSSLQARALGWLAQREHSRSELRRKLMRHAAASAQAAEEGAEEGGQNPAELAAQIEALLDLLQSKGLLSEQRFVESRVRLRSPGMGTRRIQVELAQHGLQLPPQVQQQLRASELQRAAQLCQRRFAGPATDARERARRMRFLAGRGFSGEVIRQVLSGGTSEGDDGQPDT